ncbi:MAG: hypothetical protein RH982_02770 [Parvibaculum sp.]
MTTIESDVLRRSESGTRAPKGPVTAARQRRTALIYATIVFLGLLPALLGAAPGLQAAGLGLWMPGAGFLAVGGWAMLLFPLTIALFVFSLVAWFWCGMVLAPLAVWVGTALIAGFMAPGEVSPLAYGVTALCMAGVAFAFRSRAQKRLAADTGKAAARRNFLPASLAEVQVRAAATPDEAAREMSVEDLASLRYLLDRALQPVDEFNGFNIIDQFQPAALRYQLNHMGFALGIAQGSYTPNFHGYMHEAQRKLIDKYLLRKVWGYWVYESMWGHLNFSNFDPAARDNIMLTGWFGMHVGQYMLNSGDRRYAEPGSLTFRLNEKTAYTHDFHTIIGSVVENYDHYENEFCLFPCEPNWIYPICNHYGMTSLAVHDRLFGTNYTGKYLPVWLEKLDTEFTDASGSIIGLRSKHLGFEVPFPVGEAGYANFANCFAPERAKRLWAIARKEIEPALTVDAEGGTRISLPGKGLDAGNYRTGFTAIYSSILTAAREFGDEEIAAAAQRSLDLDCGLSEEGGVRRYLGGSNLANTNAAMGRLMRAGDFRRSFVEGPSEKTLKGPVLSEARYPDVLVARAFSNGDDLSLVLHPGKGNRLQTLGLSQLAAGRRYTVTGAETASVTADADGKAKLEVLLNGRVAVNVTPV